MARTDSRFAHLSTQQRNSIFTAMNAIWVQYLHDPTFTTDEYILAHNGLVNQLARKYGVTEPMIRAVYGHVWERRRR